MCKVAWSPFCHILSLVIPIGIKSYLNDQFRRILYKVIMKIIGKLFHQFFQVNPLGTHGTQVHSFRMLYPIVDFAHAGATAVEMLSGLSRPEANLLLSSSKTSSARSWAGLRLCERCSCLCICVSKKTSSWAAGFLICSWRSGTSLAAFSRTSPRETMSQS